jgi:hypothetical protein
MVHTDTKIVFGIIYAGSILIGSTVVYLGDWRTAIATAMCVLLSGVPTLIGIRQIAEQRVEELSTGNRNASNDFYVIQLRNIEYDHGMQISAISRNLGEAQTLLSVERERFIRMTVRPKVRGKFSSPEPRTPTCLTSQTNQDGTPNV